MTFRPSPGTFSGPMRCRLAVLVALVALPATARADQVPAPVAPPLQWDPAWRSFHPAEYAASGALIAASIGNLFIQPNRGQWSGRNEIDEAARAAFRLQNPSDRLTFRALSDVLLFSAVSFPIVVDALGVARGAHGSSGVAWQMAMMDIEALAMTVALQTFVSGMASRERPFGRNCGVPYESLPEADCEGNRRYLSFFSGHSAASFAAAGLTCAHHQHLPLYGSGAADAAACGTMVAVALATASFRVLADEHYMSDILVGSAIGFATGYGLPTVLHYGVGGSSGKAPGAATVAVGAGPTPLGLSLSGTFR